MLKKRENKNYRSVPLRSYPTDKRKPQKNSKKFKKLKSSAMASFQAKNRSEKDVKERK